MKKILKLKSEALLKDVLIDGKVLLHKALFSIIETLRNENNTKNHRISYLAKKAISIDHYRGYKYVSSTSTSSSYGEQQELAQCIEDYKDTILEDAEKFYNRMIKDLTDTIIDNTDIKWCHCQYHLTCQHHYHHLFRIIPIQKKIQKFMITMIIMMTIINRIS